MDTLVIGVNVFTLRDMVDCAMTTSRRYAVGSAMLLALAIAGCAHSQPQALSSPHDVAVTVATPEAGDPHDRDDPRLAIYKVCITADGKLQSVEMIRTVAGHEKEIDAKVRAMAFRPQAAPSCPIIRMIFEGDAAVAPPPARAAEAGMPAEPAPLAAGAPTKFRNVPPTVFNQQMIESEMPHLPDVVKVMHVNEELVFMAKVCAGTDGRIVQISVLESIAGADPSIIATIRRWRLRPQPLGICTLARFVYTVGGPPRRR